MDDTQFQTEMDKLVWSEDGETITGIQGLPDEFDYELKSVDIVPESTVLPLEHQAIILKMAEVTNAISEMTGLSAEETYDTFLEQDIVVIETVDNAAERTEMKITCEGGDPNSFTWRWVRKFGSVAVDA